MGKSVDTQSRLVFSKDGGEGGMRNDCLMGIRFHLGVIKMSGARE